MIYIENTSTNPYYNLACEEYCLKNLDQDIAMLWQNDRSIIIGKHQNTIEEINGEYVRENDIKVARRITGGGAVYHDLGNLNFTFIKKVDLLDRLNLKEFAFPILKALEQMGVKAELSGRNDITIDGKKISGTAQRIHNNRVLFHGTLLFDSNLDHLTRALSVKKDKIESKGIKSVRSRVTNIKEHLKEDYSIYEFKKLLLNYLYDDIIEKEYHLKDSDLAQIKKLENKYSSWEWIYGESPKCNFKNARRFSGGKVEVLLDIQEGLITDCKIYGDFLGVSGVEAIEELLKGSRYNREDINEVLKDIDISRYFGTITREELLSCIFD